MPNKEDSISPEDLEKRLHLLNVRLEMKKKVLANSNKELRTYESEFAALNKMPIWKLIPEKGTTNTQKVNRKNIDTLIENYRYYLYELGVVDRVLHDLEELFETSNNSFVKNKVAWELIQWYANENTLYGAHKALSYLSLIQVSEKDEAKKIEAKCQMLLQQENIEKEEKIRPHKQFDIVIAADFRKPIEQLQNMLDEIKLNKQIGLKTGLLQLSDYDFTLPRELNPEVEKLIDNAAVHILQKEEMITCEIVIVRQLSILEEKQIIPIIQPNSVRVVMDEIPNQITDLRQCARNVFYYFGKLGKWFPISNTVRKAWENDRQSRFIKLSSENWAKKDNYTSFIQEWIVEDNPYIKGDGYEQR